MADGRAAARPYHKPISICVHLRYLRIKMSGAVGHHALPFAPSRLCVKTNLRMMFFVPSVSFCENGLPCFAFLVVKKLGALGALAVKRIQFEDENEDEDDSELRDYGAV